MAKAHRAELLQGVGHQLIQGITLCHLTTQVQTLVTFSISQEQKSEGKNCQRAPLPLKVSARVIWKIKQCSVRVQMISITTIT